MAKILEMPKLSPTMEEGRLATWHKKAGDTVGIDDLLAEVETDKATMEFRSFDKGTILKLLVEPGAMVTLGQPVAILGAPGESIDAVMAKIGGQGASSGKETTSSRAPSTSSDAGKSSSDAEKSSSDAGKSPSDAEKSSSNAEKSPSDAEKSSSNAGKSPSDAEKSSLNAEKSSSPAETSSEGPPSSDERVKASPWVRRVARERGMDLHGVAGSGPHGRIIERDLTKSAPSPAPQATQPPQPSKAAQSAAAPPQLPESKPLSMMRKTIARRLTEAKQQIPHFYLTVDLDVDPLVALRAQINADAIAVEGQGATKISVNDLIIKACAIGLQRAPACNAQFTPEAILYHRNIDISVAVAVDEGLVTPVVRSADKKSVRAIAAEVRDLASRAKNKKLKPEEITGGTFSISNLGMMGIDSFAAVINPPEGAILAVGQVRREPVVKDDTIVIGHRLACTLSCDHRVVDGAVGATFLKELRALVAAPTRILL